MDDRKRQQGAVSWIELSTTDVEAAKTFYAQLFGWTIAKAPMPDMNYDMIKCGDDEIGGIMPHPPQMEGAPANWCAYISVDDVDTAAAKAESLGGAVLMAPMDIPEVGRICLLRDPQGAMISAITYVNP